MEIEYGYLYSKHLYTLTAIRSCREIMKNSNRVASLQRLKASFKTAQTHLALIWQLVMDLFRFSPCRTFLTFCLMLTRSITSSVSFLLILPLLQLIGFSTGNTASHGVINAVTWVFQALHLSLNLLTILSSYVVIVCGVALVNYVEQIIGSRLQQEYTCHLRTRLHRRLLQARWSFFLNRKVSDLLYSLTSQIQQVSQCNYQLLTLINTLVLTWAYTSLALMLSWTMTLAAILCAMVLLCLMLPLHALTSRAGLHHLQQNQAIHQSITEQFGALKMIKGSGLETTFINELLTIGSALERENQQLSRVTAKSRFVYSCGSALLFSVLLYHALTVFHVPSGSLLLLLIVFARLLPMVSSAQQAYQRILHLLPAFGDIKRLLHDCMTYQEPHSAKYTAPLSFQKAITLRQVSFHYATAQSIPVINQLSIQLLKNTTTAIVGPSGSGKSTLIDLIIGLLMPVEGHIFIDDQILIPDNAGAWRKGIAYVTQDVFLFNASIRDNLTLFSPNQTDAALWNALDCAAADFVLNLEGGLDTRLGDRGVRLSGGERQRIALARALLMNPQLLVLDESTNALDRDNIAKIQQTLTRLRGKMTILIISHQQEMSHFADQKIVLTKHHQETKHAHIHFADIIT